MSVLEFVVALKWPITILVVVFFVAWRLRHNPQVGLWARGLVSSRNLRLNIAGQELELTATEEAIAKATQSDSELAALEGQAEADITEIRREAVESVMADAARYGYEWAQDGNEGPPDLSLAWSEDGQPRIRASASLVFARVDKLMSNPDIKRHMNALSRELHENSQSKRHH